MKLLYLLLYMYSRLMLHIKSVNVRSSNNLSISRAACCCQVWYCVFSLFTHVNLWGPEWMRNLLLDLTNTHNCLNSPTSQPLVNVGISILAFQLCALFACVIWALLQLKCAAKLCITVEPWDIFRSFISSHPPSWIQKSCVLNRKREARGQKS